MKLKVTSCLTALLFLSGCDYEVEIGWSKTIGGDASEQFETGILTSDGTYLLAGYAYPSGYDGQVLWLVKARDAGQVVWQKHFGDEFRGGATDIVELDDGSFVVAGRLFTEDAESQLLVVKVDALGNTVWRTSLGDVSTDVANAIAKTNDNGVIVAGFSANIETFSSEFVVVKIDAEGEVAWENNFGSGRGMDIAATEDGGAVIFGETGKDREERSTEWLGLRLDAQGEVIWQRTYGDLYADSVISMTTASDGGFVVLGTHGQQYNNVFADDIWVVKINSAGEPEWDKKISGGKLSGGKLKVARDIARSDDGYVVVGDAPGLLDNQDIYVLKLDDSGTVMSEKTYLAPFAENGHTVIPRGSDTLIVVGSSAPIESIGQTDGLIIQLSKSF